VFGIERVVTAVSGVTAVVVLACTDVTASSTVDVDTVVIASVLF